jgi:hypothetical protein
LIAEELYLTRPEDYSYTNFSGCIYLDGVDDAAEFHDTLVSLFHLLNSGIWPVTDESVTDESMTGRLRWID